MRITEGSSEEQEEADSESHIWSPCFGGFGFFSRLEKSIFAFRLRKNLGKTLSSCRVGRQAALAVRHQLIDQNQINEHRWRLPRFSGLFARRHGVENTSGWFVINYLITCLHWASCLLSVEVERASAHKVWLIESLKLDFLIESSCETHKSLDRSSNDFIKQFRKNK